MRVYYHRAAPLKITIPGRSRHPGSSWQHLGVVERTGVFGHIQRNGRFATFLRAMPLPFPTRTMNDDLSDALTAASSVLCHSALAKEATTVSARGIIRQSGGSLAPVRRVLPMQLLHRSEMGQSTTRFCGR